MAGGQRKSPEDKLKRLTSTQRAQLDQIEAGAIANFKGQVDELESAIGMLRIGHHMGWKALYIFHSKRTIRKYEEILGVKVRELFEETGPSTYRSLGYKIAEGFSNFWKVVSGAEKVDVEKKRAIER